MRDNASVELLAWDSAWLGYSVGRATAHTPQQVTDAMANAQAAGLQLLYLVVDAGAEAAIASAQATAAWLADVRLTYAMALPGVALPNEAKTPGLAYQLVTEPSAALHQLAQQSSQYSRFRRDARIPAQACDQLYAEWLSQALASGTAWAAVRQGTPVGLLTLGVREGHASIELLAVSPAARHQRIGQGLVRVAQLEARRQGREALQVVTQEANRAAQLFYEHCGFRLARREYVFHLWQQPE
ncbi:GNAT family N-acetyltransferase [Hymenobacter convexus]|uniref:GNAT family N-acetyltransferase n=1 Tax=Hymenobacter sp. CA1UV-4 TaxID=3063782 RepID=UPI0027137645|nr:GNAT family N-acetyltransferase [Hymenobacter sp. CA1UV-4]MDO7853071.1 GNAT family N-acetyltransferase [Hymenobacter sp. CA1UV-4]